VAIGSSGSTGGAPLSEINVTPLVDVMLVLLIIFMVTAPLVQSGISVDLPNAQAPALAADGEKTRITVAREVASNPASPVRVWLDRDLVPVDQLAERLRANVRVQREHEAYLQADESVPYGQVVRVMGILRQSGVTKLGIVTDPLVSQ